MILDELEISIAKKDRSVNLRVNAAFNEILPILKTAFLMGGSPGVVVTAGRDGVHSQKSAHYTGNALDLRHRDLQMDKTMFGMRLVKALNFLAGVNSDWYLVLEVDHYHLERRNKGEAPNVKGYHAGQFFYTQGSA